LIQQAAIVIESKVKQARPTTTASNQVGITPDARVHLPEKQSYQRHSLFSLHTSPACLLP